MSVEARDLSSLTITGPAAVQENSTANYTATATFSDGFTRVVTASASWGEDSAYATISRGVLTTSAVTGNQAVTITASYRSGKQTETASLSVTIEDAATGPSLSSLSITGPETVAENSTASYGAIAAFSDGTTQTVTSAATWTEDSSAATISGGVLTAGEVTADQPVTITVSYTSGGVMKTASTTATIKDGGTLSGSHAGKFTQYNGAATCLGCHSNEAMAFHQSAHYQWRGDASETVGLSTTTAGKLGGINDFCIYPDINWIGKLINLRGEVVDGGCARCHAGLGLKPTSEISQTQLENIDCLLCHSPQYKRTVQSVDGQFRFVPDTAKMTVSLMQAAVDIRKPTTATCLSCHTNAGGGNNFKRGDIETAHATATRDFDVHLASTDQGGAGLSCLSCHKSAGHRIAGRGVDLRERDITDAVSCTNCHSPAPHGTYDINKHTARVNCTVCHIPSYAKIAPTDMRRDWSAPGDVNQTTQLYEPHMRMAANVTPVYRFFNGKSQFYEFGSPAVPGANGRILMAGPLGTINDPGAKIYAMKRHEGLQPIDSEKRLLPLKIGIFFQTGDVATAIQQGAAGVGWTYNGHQFAETERYMGLYHEVAPKEQALTCSSCHEGTRMDFAALGYTPVATRNGVPLCQSCHNARTASFYDLHDRHVTKQKLDCSTCHTFSKAN